MNQNAAGKDRAAALAMGIERAFGAVESRRQRPDGRGDLPEPVVAALEPMLPMLAAPPDESTSGVIHPTPTELDAAADLLCVLNSSVAIDDLDTEAAAELYLARETNGVDVMGWTDLGDAFTRLRSSEILEDELHRGGEREPMTFSHAVDLLAGHADSRRHSSFARRLTRTAVALLPPSSRDRYDEEFAAELSELVDVGASPRAQRRHAFRLAFRILNLRIALTARLPGRSR